MHTIELYYLVFLAYSIFGWVMEVIEQFFIHKRFINRGFLIGPYCPIYGAGGVLATLLLHNYSEDMVVLFLLSVIIFSALEYLTSYVLEKIFHARWWDYSQDKFNINGRISPYTMIPFGVLGVVVIRFVNPVLFGFIDKLNPNVFDILFIVSLIIFMMDVGFSFNVLSGVGKENKLLEKDNTEEVRKIVMNKIMSLGWGARRLLKAFPNFRLIIKETRERIGANIKDYNLKQQRIKEKADKKIKAIETKHKNIINKLIKKYNKKILDAGRHR